MQTFYPKRDLTNIGKADKIQSNKGSFYPCVKKSQRKGQNGKRMMS